MLMTFKPTEIVQFLARALFVVVQNTQQEANENILQSNHTCYLNLNILYSNTLVNLSSQKNCQTPFLTPVLGFC